MLEVETLDWGKGVQLHKLNPEWREVIRILQSYITCEGRFALVFKYHIRFLQHLNQESTMNLHFFFLNILQKMSDRVKVHKDHTQQSIFHHGLIKLIVSTVLQKKGRTCKHFLFWLGIQTQQENQPRKRQMNKHYSLVKRLKKEVINESVEENVQEESSA